MPFEETCAMDERVRFCVAVDEGEATMSELCRQFKISRKTGYAVYARWCSGGAATATGSAQNAAVAFCRRPLRAPETHPST